MLYIVIIKIYMLIFKISFKVIFDIFFINFVKVEN